MATPYREKIKRQPPSLPVLPFLLPLPLVITLLFALVQNRFWSFSISLAAIAMYLLAAYFLSRANHYDRQAQKRKWSRPNRTPWRASAAVFTAVATTLVAKSIVQYDLFTSLGFGLIAAVGMLFVYGVDVKRHSRDAGHTSLSGVSHEELSEAFDEAESKISVIEEAATKTNDHALAARLQHIAAGSRGILDIIADDPKDLRSARKFLKVYLEGTQKVVSKYVSKDHLNNDDEITQNLDRVLNTIDTVIEEQREKLLKNDILSLDVQIEVLQTQLKHEGIT